MPRRAVQGLDIIGVYCLFAVAKKTWSAYTSIAAHYRIYSNAQHFVGLLHFMMGVMEQAAALYFTFTLFDTLQKISSEVYFFVVVNFKTLYLFDTFLCPWWVFLVFYFVFNLTKLLCSQLDWIFSGLWLLNESSKLDLHSLGLELQLVVFTLNWSQNEKDPGVGNKKDKHNFPKSQ